MCPCYGPASLLIDDRLYMIDDRLYVEAIDADLYVLLNVDAYICTLGIPLCRSLRSAVLVHEC